MHKDIAEAHGALLATIAAVAALLRTSTQPTALRTTLEDMASHFEAQIRRMAEALDRESATRYLKAFLETLEELRVAIPLH